jgi:hypothetical protein
VRWIRHSLLGTLALSLILGLIGPAASAASGEWQSKQTFYVLPQLTGNGAVKLVYRLLDPQGQPIGEPTETRATEPLGAVQVPAVPGIYTFEERAEDAGGNELGTATTALRFDDVEPPPPAPRVPEGWILGTEPTVLELGPPAGPLPISGIRGYELTLEESGLRFETDDDSFSLGFLPEGVDHGELVAVSGSGVRSEARPVTLAVDATAPTVSLQGLPAGWSSGPVKLTALAHDSLSGMEPAGPSGPSTALAVDGGSPTAAVGATASTWVGGNGVHIVRFYGRDAAGNVGDGGARSPQPRTALVRIDEAPPRVEFAAAQDASDPERIEALVGDPLSGPSPSRGLIAIRPAGTRASFTPLPTRVEAGRLTARWDSDSYPPGKYELLATGFDVAGNSASGTSRSHGGRMVLFNPLKTPVTLRTKLAGSHLSGSLRRSLGGPVGGQTVTITESFAAGSDRQRRTTEVRTAADGTFSLPLKPGPSREVAASFDGSRLLSRAGAPTVHLLATTRIRFHASAASASIGGRPVVFGGRVAAPGAQGALPGLPVELQFRYPGAGWSEFRTVEADSRGRFRFAYRFSDDDSRGIRFRFRAYIKGREGWPFGPSASRPVSVRGR